MPKMTQDHLQELLLAIDSQIKSITNGTDLNAVLGSVYLDGGEYPESFKRLDLLSESRAILQMDYQKAPCNGEK